LSDLNELFKILSEGKKYYEDTTPVGKKIKQVKQHAKSDLEKLFEELSSLQKQVEKLEAEPINEQVITEEIPAQPIIHTPEVRAKQVDADVNKYLTDKSFQQPKPDIVNTDIEAIRKKMQFLEQAIGRIAATGPGGGEVNLRWLDDVDRSTIYDMRYLRYNNAKKKFEFAEVNPHDIVYNTHLVTTATYTVDSDDYYVGVNYAGPTTITLPTTLLSSGRKIIVKDESGNASTNPITVLGTVDNDAGGFIIQVDNGGIQLIYRSGWRII